MTYNNFTAEGFAAFRDNDRPGPIHMLNLVQLRAQAEYEDGTIATGVEAYARYGTTSEPVLKRVGGKVVWRGTMEQMAIGPEDAEQWDLCFIVEYPSPDAFVSMVKDPEYQTAVVHRQAAVLDSRLIRLAPSPIGDGFAGANRD